MVEEFSVCIQQNVKHLTSMFNYDMFSIVKLSNIRMKYYNYHAKLKQLLNTVPYDVVKETGKFVYRFNFVNGESMPIREHRVIEYLKYI